MRRVRLALSAALLGFVSVSLTAGPVAVTKSSTPPVNVFGAPTRTAGGEPINYRAGDLAAQRSAKEAAASPKSTTAEGTPAIWSYTVFGTGIGEASILVGRGLDGRSEIYVGASTSTFGLDTYWYALRYE